jgi:hypothetical protein
MRIFFNAGRQLRDIWWVAIFFLVLAAITIPFILLSQRYDRELPVAYQAVIVVGASWLCQLLRKKPFSELVGSFNGTWLKNLLIGILIGAVIMLIPAFILWMGGWVRWECQPFDPGELLSVTGVFISVAVAEEFLFRGFLFQRLNASIGIWGAQIIMAGYFLLVHLDNPGMAGSVKLFASVNIFLASIMFGLAFIKTASLAMPIGLHFMANWVQGCLLGFGVSGNEQVSMLNPVFAKAPVWLTGGSFGLEASVPGLIFVL